MAIITGSADVSPPLRRKSPWETGRSVAWLVLVLGVVLSFPAWFLTHSLVEREAQLKFRSAATALAASANAHVGSYADLLYGLRGLFQADPALSRKAFDRYVYSLDLPLHYPGVRSVSYVRRVPAAAIGKFDAQLRRDPELIRRGVENVAVHPFAERPDYLVLTYVEPLHANKSVLGYDLASDDVRIAVVERARDTGMPILTGPIALKADAAPGEPGLVMRLALYRENAFTPDVERRRDAFIGLANVTFQVDDLVQHIQATEEFRMFTIGIHDAGYVDSTPRPALQALYSNAAYLPPRDGSFFEQSVNVDVGERRWVLTLGAPKALFLRASDKVLPWAAFGTVLAGSLLLSGLVFSLVGYRRRAEELAARMTIDLRASQSRLVEEQRRTQELIEVLPNPIYFKSTDGCYLGVNKAWETFFGLPREAFLGKTVHDLYPDEPEIADRLKAGDQELWDHPGTNSTETTIATRDGKLHNAIYYKATFTGADGNTAGLVGTIVDITERKQAELRLTLEHAVVRLLSEADRSSGIMAKLLGIIAEAFDCAYGAWWMADEKASVMTCVETWNIASENISAFSAGSRQLRPPLNAPGGLFLRVWNSGEPVWIDKVDQDSTIRRARLAANAGLQSAFAFPIRSGKTTLGVMEFFSRASRPPDESLLMSTRAIGKQIGLFIARRQAEERIRHLAHYDELTGLANRSMFNESLKRAAASARRNNTTLVVLFIDLDRFKNINDTLGHGAGDIVLKEVAQRLLGCLRASDTVGRFGGDEFVVLLEGMQQPTLAAPVAQNILDAIARPFTLGAQDYHLGASIGISSFPADCEDTHGLMKNADIAMYRAKDEGRNNFQFYSAALNVHTQERLNLESDLRRALERNEFVLHYQPKVDIGSGRITGVEVLLRWQHPTRGLVAPMQFIPLAEETGLIVPISMWVLKTACARHASWQAQGMAPLPIAVNLSARQFAHANLLRDVAAIIDETSLDPAMLEFEVTESTMMKDPDHAAKVLAAIKSMGIFLSIDDFGTGYSSLSYLKRFPIDCVKIDRAFIGGLPEDGDDAAIARAIIAMAHGLRMSVVAEGVETAGQLEFLRANGCDGMQGYLFSKPVPERELASLVRNQATVRRPAVVACAL